MAISGEEDVGSTDGEGRGNPEPSPAREEADPGTVKGSVGRAARAPLSRRVIVVGGAVLLLSLAAAALDARRSRPGRLTLRRNGHDVRIVVRREGRVVLPGTTDRFVTLPPGSYDLSLQDDPAGLRVVPGRVTVAPAGEADASVEDLSTPAGPAPSVPAPDTARSR